MSSCAAADEVTSACAPDDADGDMVFDSDAPSSVLGRRSHESTAAAALEPRRGRIGGALVLSGTACRGVCSAPRKSDETPLSSSLSTFASRGRCQTLRLSSP